MYYLNPYAPALFILSVYFLFLGAFIFLSRRKIWTNFVCSLPYYCCAMWIFGYAMLYSSKDPGSLLWPKFVYSGVIFIGPTFYHSTVVLLGLKRQKKLVRAAYFTGLVFLAQVLFTNTLIVGLKKHAWGYHTLVSPAFHIPFLLFFIITYGGALKNLFDKYRKKGFRQEQPLEFTRIRYLFLQYLMGALGGLNYFTDWGFEFYPFVGYILVTIGITLVAYAILKHRLLDIPVVITRTGIFIAVYTIVLGIPFVITGWSKNWLVKECGINWWILPLGLMAAFATIGPFIYIYLDRKAEKRLLREQNRYREILKQAARESARIHNLRKLLNLIVYTVTKTVRISYSGLYLFDEHEVRFNLKALRNIKKKQPTFIDKDSPLAAWLKDYKEPLVREEVKRRAEEGQDSVFVKIEKEMRALNATVAVPSFLEDKLLYILVLGDKRSGGIYASEDLNVFSLLASQTALAIENASLYENMEDKVKSRTKELMETQKQLIQAEKLATVGTLAGGVAHEINNPLVAILTNAQMMLSTVENKDDKESLEMIEEAAKRCRSIVQKLMVYSRKPMAGREVSKLDLKKALDNVNAFLGYQLSQENIKVNVNFQGSGPFLVDGSQNEIEQVITNLFLNSKDAIKKIARAGEINVSVSKGPGSVIIKVSDTGCGISKEYVSKIFDPFFTTKDVGKGTGLGLSICQSIIEEHKGTITVESGSKQGATFIITLPASL